MAKHSAQPGGKIWLQIIASLIGLAIVVCITITVLVAHNRKVAQDATAAPSLAITVPPTSASPVAAATSTPPSPTTTVSTSGTLSHQAAVLQQQLEQKLAGFSGSWQVFVQPLTGTATVLEINSHPQPGASLLKLFVMLAVFDQIEQGQFAGENPDSLLQQMITVSSNSAANLLLKQLGNGNIETGFAVVNTTAKKYGFTDTSLADSFHDDGSGLATAKLTSARDTGLFLVKAYQGQLPHSDQMLALLKQQQRNTKISLGIPAGVTVAHKTGEVPGVENDAGIIYADSSPFVLTVLTNEISASTARTQIGQVASLVYEELASK